MTLWRSNREPTKHGAGGDHRLSILLAVGFAGLTFHNLREFPVSVLVRGDTLTLLAVTVALGVWWGRTRSRSACSALLGWGLLHVIGGGLVVGGGLGPLIGDLTGDEVAYDLSHHLGHWIYGATHAPLVWMAWRTRRDLVGAAQPEVGTLQPD